MRTAGERAGVGGGKYGEVGEKLCVRESEKRGGEGEKGRAGRSRARVHLQDAVGVDVESDLDLRPSARHRRDAVEVELAQNVVVLGETALALVHLVATRARVCVCERDGVGVSVGVGVGGWM
eukprot:444784-Pleurochrysis_carterae.AAC.1